MNAELIQDNYEFNAPPRVIQKMRYREVACNIMWDKRVVRGNTYNSIVSQKEPIIQTTVKRVKQVKVVTEKKEDETVHNEETQTENNVEEQTDKPPRHQKETQTEFIIEKVVPRLYMKEKTGIDVETQVWDDGELFNFEYEAEPILQVLVQKTLDLSRMEVLQEEELREMKEQQEHYHRLKQAELAEQDRLEKKEQQLYNDNIKLKQQYHNQKQRDIRTHEKLVCRVLGKQFQTKVQINVLQILKAQGFFRDQVEVQLIEQYLPWIYDEVKFELQNTESIDKEYDELINSIDQQLFVKHSEVLELERQRRAQILEQREQDRLAKEEDLRQRRERRKIRLERERRQRLREQAAEFLLSKGEERDALSLISDIDGYLSGAPFIGHFGGIFGEFIIFINAIVQNEQKFEPEEYEEFMQNVLAALPETTVIEIGINENIDATLAELDPELNLGALPEQLTPQIEEALRNNIMFSIQNHLEDLQYVKEIINTLFKCLLEVRPKLKFVKCKEQVDFNKLPCIIRVIPSMESLPFNPKSGKVRPEPLHLEEGEEQHTEEEIINPKNLAEAQPEKKATATLCQAEEISTAIIHDVSQFFVRQILTIHFGESELPFLIDIIDRCQTVENSIIQKINPNLAQIEVNQY